MVNIIFEVLSAALPLKSTHPNHLSALNTSCLILHLLSFYLPSLSFCLLKYLTSCLTTELKWPSTPLEGGTGLELFFPISYTGYITDSLEILVLQVLLIEFSSFCWVPLQLLALWLAASAKLPSPWPFLLVPRKLASESLAFKVDDCYLICTPWSQAKDPRKTPGTLEEGQVFPVTLFFFLLLAYHYVHPYFQIRTGIFCWIHLYQRKTEGCYF